MWGTAVGDRAVRGDDQAGQNDPDVINIEESQAAGLSYRFRDSHDKRFRSPCYLFPLGLFSLGPGPQRRHSLFNDGRSGNQLSLSSSSC